VNRYWQTLKKWWDWEIAVGIFALGGSFYFGRVRLPNASEIIAGENTTLLNAYTVLVGLETTLALGLFMDGC
jgi:hypothetical protein